MFQGAISCKRGCQRRVYLRGVCRQCYHLVKKGLLPVTELAPSRELENRQRWQREWSRRFMEGRFVS